MSIFETARVVCDVFNEKLSQKRNPDGTIPAKFSVDIYAIKHAKLAEAINQLLSVASQKTFPDINITWPEPTPSGDGGGDGHTFTLNVNKKHLSPEELNRIHKASLSAEFNYMREEFSCKIPHVNKPSDRVINYTILPENFKHISPESFIVILEKWKEAYELGDGLNVGLEEGKVRVDISAKAALTISNKEQLDTRHHTKDFEQQTEKLHSAPFKKREKSGPIAIPRVPQDHLNAILSRQSPQGNIISNGESPPKAVISI